MSDSLYKLVFRVQWKSIILLFPYPWVDLDFRRHLQAAENLASHLNREINDYVGVWRDGKQKKGALGDSTFAVDVPLERGVTDFFSDTDFNALVVTEDQGPIRQDTDYEAVYVIDPLDGSRNARRNLPFYGTSIAVYEPEASSVLDAKAAVVRRFDEKEVFTWSSGCKPTLNGRALKPSTKQDFTDLVLASGNHFASSYDIYLPLFKKLGEGGYDVWIKSLGASALELCYLACGRLDAVCDIRSLYCRAPQPQVYDVAAGLNILAATQAPFVYGSRRLDGRLDLDAGLPACFVGACSQNIYDKIISTINE
ncbi:MAG: hypothetical protein GF334_13725 [Candidatus Altiarchaeales archaeon]|nr:hypothetical protein [Candidatus Altiarchaeales archaeon]